MKEIDVYFLEHPYYGVERMIDYPNLDRGYHENVKKSYKPMGLKYGTPEMHNSNQDTQNPVYQHSIYRSIQKG